MAGFSDADTSYGIYNNFETAAIHVGSEPDATTGAVVPPISLATT